MTTTAEAPPIDPRHLASVAALRLSQIAALTSTMRQLQIELAAWQPLAIQHEREMASRVESGFAVDDLRTWIADLVRARRGGAVEDMEAVAQWLER